MSWRLAALCFVGFLIGGLLAGQAPWLQWVYEELRRSLASETAKVVADSWPIAVVVVALLFRKQIADRIFNMERLAAVGVEAQFKSQQQLLARKPSDMSEVAAPPPGARVGERNALVAASVDATLEKSSDPYFLEREEALKASLRAKGILDVPEQALRLTTRWTAVALAFAEFEYIYGGIWGGQLALLREAHRNPVPMAQATAFFEAWRKRNTITVPDSLDRWLLFFSLHGLAEQRNEELHLTPKGRALVDFLNAVKRPNPLLYP